MDQFEPSAAARLIETRRLASGMSMRRAAAAADLSEGRWRQIVKGYQQAAKGIRVPVNAPDETLARMANAMKVHPDEMETAGHPEVAALMRDMASGPTATATATAASHLSDDELLAELSRRLTARREDDPQKVGGGDDRDAAPIGAETGRASAVEFDNGDDEDEEAARPQHSSRSGQ